MPSGLSGVIAIAAGGMHSLALKSDGTVVAWGQNGIGQCTVPPDLRGVIAIAAGMAHSLALTSDGSIVPWGNPAYGLGTVSTGPSGVIAIAAGDYHNLRLESDGTVLAWGAGDAAGSGTGTIEDGRGQSIVPPNLNGVIAIAAGGYHSLALKSDGTVVAWGDDCLCASTVPTDLRGVIAIAAGEEHSLALKSDGTISAWGDNRQGQITLPRNFSGVIAMDAVLGNGSVRLMVTCPTGLNPVVQASSNLLDWVPIQTIVITNSPLTVVDPVATDHQQRFYRAVVP